MFIDIKQIFLHLQHLKKGSVTLFTADAVHSHSDLTSLAELGIEASIEFPSRNFKGMFFFFFFFPPLDFSELEVRSYDFMTLLSNTALSIQVLLRSNVLVLMFNMFT